MHTKPRDSQNKANGTLGIHRPGRNPGQDRASNVLERCRATSTEQRCTAAHSSEQGEQATAFRLSFLPPTTNTLFYNRSGKGRRKTSRYREWLRSAGWELRLQKPQTVAGRVSIEIRLPDIPGRAPDPDNALKALIDLMVRHRLIERDDKSIVRSIAVVWDDAITDLQASIRSARSSPYRGKT